MSDDPILDQRRRIERVANVGTRFGYGSLLVAMVAFFVGLATDFPSWSVTFAVGGLVAACVVMPIPMVLGYGVKAADRDDRERRQTNHD